MIFKSFSWWSERAEESPSKLLLQWEGKAVAVPYGTCFTSKTLQNSSSVEDTVALKETAAEARQPI